MRALWLRVSLLSATARKRSCTHTKRRSLQRRRAERSRLDRWRIQIAAEARARWRSYQRALEHRPLRTKALTSFYGLVLADLIAQAADPGSYDIMRTARMGAFGLAWHGISVRASHSS